MSDRHPRRKPSLHTTTRHRFSVHHQVKQRLLLKALNDMDTSAETPEESRAIVEMITRLEKLLSSRQCVRVLRGDSDPTPAKSRKRCSYGTQKSDTHQTLKARG